MMKILDGLLLSQRACDTVVESGGYLIKGIIDSLHETVRDKVAVGVPVEEIDELFHDKTLINPFHGLETKHQQQKFIQENFRLIVIKLPSPFFHYL
jgi:hypothetical protein